MLYNRCDLHTHTLFSRHAYSTIMENLQAAHDVGLELLGSADHFSDMLFTEPSVKNFQFFQDLGVWPREWKGVKLLRACEADIVDCDGHLYGHDIMLDQNILGNNIEPRTLQDYAFSLLDYVVASVHNRKFAEGESVAHTTQMYINVLQQPKVLVLGHTGRSGIPFEIDPVLDTAHDLHKLVEINEHTFGLHNEKSMSRCRTIAEKCAERGVSIAVSSDSHIATDVGASRNVLAMLEEIGFPQELIATRSASAFLDCAHAAGLAENIEA